MRYWRKVSLFPIQLLLSHMSKPFDSVQSIELSILYTNSKLRKIGYIADDLCTFCKHESETMQQLFYDCSYSITFWKDFELYYLSLTQQQIHFNLKDIFIGLLTPELPLLNYLILIGKIYLWACRRNKELPSIRGFKSKVKLKYET